MKLLLLAMLLASPSAFAGTYEDAMKICQSISFAPSQTECTDFVLTQQTKYFDERAIGTCQRARFYFVRIECLQVIAGKIYDPAEIFECRRESFGSDIVKCLQYYGRPYDAPVPARPSPIRPRPRN